MAMDQLWISIITTVCTVAASLLVTYIFNKVSGLPKKIVEEKKAREDRISTIEETAVTNKAEILNEINDVKTELTQKFETFVTAITPRVEAVEEAVSHYPEYREQSLQIQAQLQKADKTILDLCETIKDQVIANGEKMDLRLSSLEHREKNSLRAKILNEYRLYTDEHKNPIQA